MDRRRQRARPDLRELRELSQGRAGLGPGFLIWRFGSCKAGVGSDLEAVPRDSTWRRADQAGRRRHRGRPGMDGRIHPPGPGPGSGRAARESPRITARPRVGTSRTPSCWKNSKLSALAQYAASLPPAMRSAGWRFFDPGGRPRPGLPSFGAPAGQGMIARMFRNPGGPTRSARMASELLKPRWTGRTGRPRGALGTAAVCAATTSGERPVHLARAPASPARVLNASRS